MSPIAAITFQKVNNINQKKARFSFFFISYSRVLNCVSLKLSLFIMIKDRSLSCQLAEIFFGSGRMKTLLYSFSNEERKWDLLEGPKGRFGWGHHPYTLLTAIFTIRHNADRSISHGYMYVHIFSFLFPFVQQSFNNNRKSIIVSF